MTLLDTPYVADRTRSDGLEIFIADKYGVRYGELPRAAIQSVTWARNDNGAACSLDLSSLDPDTVQALLARRDLQLIWNDVINIDTGLPEAWWGTIWQRRGKPGKTSLSLEGVASWLKVRMVDAASLDYASMDQLDIGWNLVNAAQTGTNRDLNFVATYSPSGYNRFRRYDRTSHKFYWDALQEFPVLTNGFEWNIVPDFVARLRRWTPYYPQKGSVKSSPWFRWGVNIVDYDLDENAQKIKTKVYAKGAMSGGVAFEQFYEDAAASALYGQMEGVTNDGSQKDIGWLLDKATKTVNLLKSPFLTLKITVRDMPAGPDGQPAIPVFGKIHDGDTVQVDIDDGANQVHGQLRVDTFTWKGPGLYDLTFVNPASSVTAS